jgi:hypothetical protein
MQAIPFIRRIDEMNPRTIAFSNYVRKPLLSSLALVLMAISLMSVPAHARKTCNALSITIGTKVFSGKQTILVPASKVNNQIAHAQGKFADFFVDMNSFTVLNYTLNGTKVYDSNIPTVRGRLNSPLLLTLNNEQLVLQRSGSGVDQYLKVQAKDCDNGGTFQLESGTAGQQTNDLANGINYCLLDSLGGKLFFTNGPLLGYDSPQLAKNSNWSSINSTWAVKARGRMGMVTGEDADLALAATGNPAACGR